MGLYIRKSVRVGPFRFNLSKSGVGVSAGVKGFRVGTGPRGNYIHMGRGGLYYRKTFPPGTDERRPSKPKPSFEDTQPIKIPPGTHEPLREIDSGEIGEMIDSSSKDLVNELNSKRKRIRLWPGMVAITVVAFVVVANQPAPPWAAYVTLGVGAAIALLTYYKDILGKSTVMLYDIESDFSGVIEKLHFAFEGMKGCRASWHLEAEGRVKDSKYHAGASHLVRRKSITLTLNNPPFVKTNVATPSIHVGKQTLYFFPDKVLVFEPNGVGAVSYENLEVDISHTRFIEDGSVPKDSEIVDRTWKYVNKRGGPDKRFKDNCQLPVVLYEEVHFSSNTGLNERIQLSRTGRSSSFEQAIKNVGEASAAYGQKHVAGDV